MVKYRYLGVDSPRYEKLAPPFTMALDKLVPLSFSFLICQKEDNRSKIKQVISPLILRTSQHKGSTTTYCTTVWGSRFKHMFIISLS